MKRTPSSPSTRTNPSGYFFPLNIRKEVKGETISKSVNEKLEKRLTLIHNKPSLINESVDDKKNTPLTLAVLKGDEALVKLLLSFPELDPNRSAKNGVTALHFACDQEKDEIVQLLLGHSGINVNATNDFGDTPLHFACAKGNEVIVWQLISFPGIDDQKRNKRGRSARDEICQGWGVSMQKKPAIEILLMG